MKKMIWRNILAVSVSSLGMSSVVFADVNSPVGIQRSFLNLGFEREPSLTWKKSGEWGCRDQNGSWSKSYCIFDQKGVEGWRTTAKYEGLIREIELWKAGQLVANDQNWGPKPAEGKIYAELNSTTAAALYQNVCVSEKDVLNWSFSHRPRENIAEQAGFFIANAVDDKSTTGKINLDFTNISDKYLKKTDVLTSTPGKLYGNVLDTPWKSYSGSNVQLSKYLGGRKSGVMAFGFEALQTQGSAERGNWLDNIVLNLNPGIEFSAKSGSVIENQTGKYHSVDFNIVGNVTGNIKVKFIIDKNKVEKAAQYRSGTSEVGDYKIYKLDKNGIPLQEIVPTEDPTNSNVLKFEYEIQYDSSLKYDTGVTVKGLAIRVFDNNLTDGTRTIPFELDPDQTGLALLDLRTCGDTVFSGFKYEIQDDEVDLEVTKTLNEKAPLPGQNVSYMIELFNHKNTAANNVILKDEILANLDKTNAKLECKDFTTNTAGEACPSTIDTNKVADLFTTNGLNIGTIKGNAKYIFTISNLKVSASDTGTDENIGYIANRVEVSTASNDINLDNNNAIAKNLYAAKNDLFNADATKTGTGLFVIDNNGQPLWTKSSQENKAYFPLSIKNEATLAQDYQLYASSTAIAPTLSTGGYSTLVKSGINSFTSSLKIEFYKVDEAQCKTGLNTQQITQLNVAANTIAQVCAVVTVSPSVTATTNIWFAIESLQSGLGDVILDAVIPPAQKRLLELTNDQSAQVGVGGTYVFLHRLTNYGVADETKVKVSLNAVNGKDGFLYTLFVDKNGNDMLDATDTLLSDLETELSHIIRPNQSVTLLIKAEAPATATNGMNSQVKLIVKPDNTGKEIALVDLMNTDLITVSPNQLKILKSQLKVENCDMPDKSAVMNATYTVQNENLKPNQCLIYRILVKNMGNAPLSNVVINDMYPAYTQPWKSGTVLPMTSSGEAVEDNASRVKTTFVELLPQQQESLYFGIKLN